MIRRLLSIKDSGNWRNFTWDHANPDLARINVIYGGNGAGKTSLSEALRALTKDAEAAQRVSLEVETGGTRTQTSSLANSVFDRLFVFNEHFVDKAHKLSKDAADMEAVLTVGERTVEAEAELEKLRPQLEETSKQHEAILTQTVARPKQLEAKYKAVSGQVVDTLSKATDRYASRGKYSSRIVKGMFDGSGDGWTELDDATLAKRVATAQATNRESLKIDRFSVAVGPTILTRSQEALSKSPVSVMLDSLTTHPDATSWVDDGRELHKDSSECIFCGGSLSASRKSDIEKHFSDEVGDLQRDIDALIRELDEVDAKVANAKQNVVNATLLFEDLREKHAAAKTDFDAAASTLTEWTKHSRARLKSKRENVLSVDDGDLSSPPTLDDKVLAAIYDEHDTRVSTHDELVKKAAEEVEKHYLKLASQDILDQKNQISKNTAEESRLREEVKRLGEEIKSLESVDGDPLPSAKILTDRVSQLLGRTELAFELRDNHYTVTRRGEPAVGLSVGERTAITLVHFLEMVSQFKADSGGPIVVIDDPVSSLDSNIFMGVSTAIWTEAITKDHLDQLILLTHNFELFRQWDVQTQGIPYKIRNAIGFEFYEINSRHQLVAGSPQREPRLTTWPPSERVRKKVRSSYHHAWMVIVDAKLQLDSNDSLESRLDAQILFPNVMRRLLETFLAFKLPEQTGDFNMAMKSAGELLTASNFAGDADALRQRLTRYTHAYSHGDTPGTDQIVSPDEAHTAITAIFKFIEAVDVAHFEGMCSVLKVDPKTLVAELPT